MSAFGGNWGGADLDLTENSVSEGLPLLKTGVYDAISGEPELKTSKNGKMLSVAFTDEGGRGQITFNFNYVHSSAEAQRIGRDQLKTFLTHGGHPDPDHPFNHPKEKMRGLKVRIYVEHDGTYVKNNQTRDSFAIKRFAPVDPAVPAAGPSAAPVPASASRSSSGGGSTASHQRPLGGLDDDIPF